MKNKQLFQDKIARLESTLGAVSRSVAMNDREQAYELVAKAKEILSDLQSMVNREEEYYR